MWCRCVCCVCVCVGFGVFAVFGLLRVGVVRVDCAFAWWLVACLCCLFWFILVGLLLCVLFCFVLLCGFVFGGGYCGLLCVLLHYVCCVVLGVAVFVVVVPCCGLRCCVVIVCVVCGVVCSALDVSFDLRLICG